MSIANPTWTTRIWQEFRAGNLTRAYRDVLLTLRTYRGTGGTAWPSHETLADRAECCAKTVQRALAQAKGLDLIHWAERRVRAGWRWLRTSNLYRFTAPETPVRPGLRAPAPLTDSRAGEGRVSKKEGALNKWLREAASLPDLLLRRRRQMATRFAG